MQTRTEAIEYFTGLGYKSFARDWALGQTIAICKGVPQKTQIGEYEADVWPSIIYLYPSNETWFLCDTDKIDEIKFASLDEAVTAAQKILEKSNTRKPK